MKKLQQSTAILFIRWNLFNMVCVAVAYFEKGKMVYIKVDKLKIRKICNDFLPKEVNYDFVSELPILIKKNKISEKRWNEVAIQRGIYDIQKTSPVARKLTLKEFNNLSKIYLE